MGRRTSSTDTSGTTTFFHYDGWNVVAESDTSGTITANYYYDTNGQIMAMKKAGQTYYYQFNAHGDVVSLTDSSGTEVNTYTYDPWGNHLPTSETVSNPFRYAGYRWDEDTGLYYLRARYYGPGMMRFLTQDGYPFSKTKPQSLNNYAYVLNNPIRYFDPSGLFWEEVESALHQESVTTNLGEQAVEWYAERYAKAKTWYEKAAYGGGGLFSSLWTPDTWWKTATTLIGAKAVAPWAAAHNVMLRGGEIVIYRVADSFTKIRINPLGNWQAKEWFKKLPHYHRRGKGGIGRHRPWQ